MKDRTPFVLGQEVDEIFGVEEARGVGTVIRSSDLRDDLGYLREAGDKYSRLIHHASALGRASAGRERAASPNGTLIQMRQELGTNDTAKYEKDSQAQRQACNADGHQSMLDRPTD